MIETSQTGLASDKEKQRGNWWTGKSIQISLKFSWDPRMYFIVAFQKSYTHTILKISKLWHNKMIYLYFLVYKQYKCCDQETPFENASEQYNIFIFIKARMHTLWPINFLFPNSYLSKKWFPKNLREPEGSMCNKNL